MQFERPWPTPPGITWTRTPAGVHITPTAIIRPAVVSEEIIPELLRTMRKSACPKCGYRYKPTRRTRRYPLALRDAVSVAALALHALEVHGRDIAALRAEEQR